MKILDIRHRLITLELHPEDAMAIAEVLGVALRHHLITDRHRMLCEALLSCCEAGAMAALAESIAVRLPDDWSLADVRERLAFLPATEVGK